MLDISRKYSTLRTAIAEARLTLLPATVKMIHERRIPKGDPLEVARVAAVLAAKSTPTLIPYCHPIPITFVGVEFDVGESSIVLKATVKAIAATGVEMEALIAASVAALTLYDMLKMVDQTMAIEGIRLMSKKGGKSDFRAIAEQPLKAAVIVMSDSVSAGKKPDASGRLIEERLCAEGLEIADYQVIPDELEQIVRLITRLADEKKVDLILTTGGTGFGPRDVTPEAMLKVIDREIPGIPEAMRVYGQQRTPYSMFSRAKAGLSGNTLIVNLPGSRKAVIESLDLLFPALLHSLAMIRGGGWEDHQTEEA